MINSIDGSSLSLNGLIAPSDGGHWRVRPDHEPVSSSSQEGPFQTELDPSLLSRSDLVPLQSDDAGHDLRGAEMDSDSLTVLDRPPRPLDDV